jgi:hypothetical protein
MGAPPVGLGYCETCLFYDAAVDPTGYGYCRLVPPSAQLEGRWPKCLPMDWCAAWTSPTALPMDLGVVPEQAPRNSGMLTVAVVAEGGGQFLAEDIVRFNAVPQATTRQSPVEVRFVLDTAQGAGSYPVRVLRPSINRLSHATPFVLT